MSAATIVTPNSSIAAAELPDLMEAGPLMMAEDELPTPVLLAQGRRADLVWTRSEYMRLLRHLHNGNPETHFYHGWWTNQDFSTRQLITPKWKACWSKGATMTRKADEAWSTICGKREAEEVTIGFPAANTFTKESCWGGIDWDGEEGEESADRAREWAFRAFELCRRYEEFFLILETSGSAGWHLYILRETPRPAEEWTRMLRQIAALIGVPKIAKGICEIFPPDNASRKKFGNILRAPGTFNGFSGKFSEIVYETTKPLLARLPAPIDQGSWKAHVVGDPHYIGERLCSGALIKAQGKVSPKQAAALAAKLNLDLSDAEIRVGHRYRPLQTLIGQTFPKIGRPLATALAEFYFDKSGGTQQCREWGQHHAEFTACWDWMLASEFEPTLTPAERAIYEKLTEESWRDAFRIIRNFAWADAKSEEPRGAFGVSVLSLGMRLLLERKAASKIRRRLEAAGALQKVAPPIPGQRSTIYRWLPCDQQTLRNIKGPNP